MSQHVGTCFGRLGDECEYVAPTPAPYNGAGLRPQNRGRRADFTSDRLLLEEDERLHSIPSSIPPPMTSAAPAPAAPAPPTPKE